MQSSKQFLSIQNQVRRRDKYVCVLCGMTTQESLQIWGKQLDVHRLEPGSSYSLDGCVTVCRKCHGPLPKSAYGKKANGDRNGGCFFDRHVGELVPMSKVAAMIGCPPEEAMHLIKEFPSLMNALGYS